MCALTLERAAASVTGGAARQSDSLLLTEMCMKPLRA